jgi:hypothetical protein
MLFRVLGLATCFLLSASAFADTAADCIADFEEAKALYDTSSVDNSLNCIREKHSFNFFANASAPLGCGGEDEWHLEAKSTTGKSGTCSVRLHGSPGEGCGTEKIERELDISEAAKWRNFLDQECRK